MIIKKLKLDNFWSHKDTEVTFNKDFYMILGRVKNSNKSNGSGKCISMNSLISTNEGIYSLEEFFPKNSLIYKKEKESWYNYKGTAKLFNMYKNLELPKKAYYQGNIKTLKLTTKGGMYIEGTPNHKIYVSNGMDLYFESLENIKKHPERYEVVIPTNYFNNSNTYVPLKENKQWLVYSNNKQRLPKILNEQLAYYIGIILGDGHIEANSIIVTTADEAIVESMESFYNSLDFKYTTKKRNKHYEIRINNKRFLKFLLINGLLTEDLSYNKIMPKTVSNSPKSVLISLLAGLFDTDASIAKNGRFEISLTSKNLIKHTQILLLQLGIFSSFIIKKQGKHATVYRLFINSKEDLKKLKEYGFFKLNRKLNRIKPNNYNTFTYNLFRSIKLAKVTKEELSKLMPHGHKKQINERVYFNNQNNPRVSLNKIYEVQDILKKYNKKHEFIDKLKKGYIFLPIKAIEEGFAEVADFNMPKTHSFIANGIINHNSSIARAIGFSLYGDASSEIKNTDAIYNDAKKMSVELTFELNNITYVVTRNVKRKGSPVIFISVNGGENVKYKIKEGQEKINSILGADFEVYSKTSYFKQGDLNSFSNLTPKEAKEVVIKLLQLDAYNTYEDRAKIKISEVTEAIRDTESKLAQLEVMIRTEETRSAPKYTQDDLESAKNKLADLNVKLEKQKAEEKYKTDKINKVIAKSGEVKSEQCTVNGQISTLNIRLRKFEGLSDVCPTCESKLNTEDIQTILVTLQKEIEPYTAKLVELDSKLARYNEEEKTVRAIEIDTDNHQHYISEVSRDIGMIEADLQKQAQDLDKIKKYKNNLIKGQVKLTDQTALLSKYEKLKVAFGKKGIQAFIIENVIPEIQATTNEILEGLDTDIRIIIESQRDLKNGGKAETLDIKVLTEFGERPYTNYSGGEKTFIDFALRIALAIILTRRSECQIQTLILDEVWGQLDTVNRKLASKALRYVANKFNFEKILIISHQEELQDSFNNIIQVEFDGQESNIIKND